MTDNNEKSNEFMITDYLPYQTAADLLAIKDEMFKAREHILEKYPNLQQDYAARKAYSKYSVNGDDGFGGFNPSLIRHLVNNRGKAKVTETVPIVTEKMNLYYTEGVYDTDGNILLLNLHIIYASTKEDSIVNVVYFVDYDDYKYFFTWSSLNAEVGYWISRAKYEDGRTAMFEEISGSSYYAEKYFMFDNAYHCITEVLSKPLSEFGDSYEEAKNNFIARCDEDLRNLDKRLKELNISPENYPNYNYIAHEHKEIMLKQLSDFYEGLDLPILDMSSWHCRVYLYELGFSNTGKLKQLEEVNLHNGKYRLVYPKRPKKSQTSSGLPRTKECLKMLKRRLTDNGYTTKKGIPFATFWKVFKEFTVNDKFDCADDELLWEPMNNSIHIARQFCHNNADGEYEYMEQLNIDFDIVFAKPTENAFDRTFWSDGDFVKFFERVEQSDEFKSSDPETIIKLSMYFGKV